MTAAGKINASNVQAGDRIVVRIERNDAGLFTGLHESRTKTHADDLVVRVTGKTFRAAQGPYEARGKYIIETTAGAFEAAPIQTMILAPEDAAGIKRAYAEALEEDEEFTRVRKAMAELEAEEAAAQAAHAEMVADVLTPAQAETVAAGEPVILADPAQVDALLARIGTVAEAAKPALETLAKVSAGLGSTLRPVLEAGVRLARTIPEGRRRHGQTKARRDALRHARKLELAGI